METMFRPGKKKLYIDITTGLTPYEILFERPYRLPQFKNQWEIDEEANLADYMRNKKQNKNRNKLMKILLFPSRKSN